MYISPRSDQPSNLTYLGAYINVYYTFIRVAQVICLLWNFLIYFSCIKQRKQKILLDRAKTLQSLN